MHCFLLSMSHAEDYWRSAGSVDIDILLSELSVVFSITIGMF